MPCLLVLLAVLAPRVVSVLLYLFTGFFDAAFSGRLLLLIGVIALPFTTLAYAWMINSYGAIGNTTSIVVLVIAVIVDLSSLQGGSRYRRR